MKYHNIGFFLVLVIGITIFSPPFLHAQEEPQINITTWENEDISGTFRGFSPDGSRITYRQEEQTSSIPLRNLLHIAFAGRKSNPSGPLMFTLHTGDRLVGSAGTEEMEEGVVLHSPDLVKPKELPLTRIKRIRNLKRTNRVEVQENVEDEDYLLTTDDDLNRGYVIDIQPNHLLFYDRYLEENLKVAHGDIRQVGLTATEDVPQAPDQPYLEVQTVEGSRLMGTPQKNDRNDVLRLSPFGSQGEWNIPVSQIQHIFVRNGRTTYLSDLRVDTSHTEQRYPWYDLEEPLPRRYRWRKDEGLPAIPGETRPIRIKNQKYEKGMSAVPYTRLEYDLNGRYDSFMSTVGLLDSAYRAGQQGSVIFRVFVDGEKKYDSGKKTYDAFPEQVEVNVSGARRLVLEVDVGEGYLDFAAWADARLIRPE